MARQRKGDTPVQQTRAAPASLPAIRVGATAHAAVLHPNPLLAPLPNPPPRQRRGGRG